MPDLERTGSAAVARGGSRTGAVREFLAFKLVDDFYGVELTRIREILTPPPLTLVPRSPPDVIGVCSVRGLLVTVVDLRRRLRLEERPQTRQSRILLANTEDDEVLGLLVDEVRQVVRLAPSEIELASSVLGGELTEHVVGIGRPRDFRFGGDIPSSQENILILLDLFTIVGS